MMKNGKQMGKVFGMRVSWCLLFAFLYVSVTFSQNLRQLTVEDGLASSAVTAIAQSDDGMLWFGTLDGVNLYYGDHVVRPDMMAFEAFEGYLIEQLLETRKRNLWIQTTYGLHKLERLSGKTVSFPQFTDGYKLRIAGEDRVLVWDVQDKMYLSQLDGNHFKPVDFSLSKGEILVELGGTDEFCWVASDKGVYRYLWSEGEESVKLEQALCLMDVSIKYCQITENPDILYVIDGKNRFYQLNIRKNEMTFVLDLTEELSLRGMPSSIIINNGAYFISFKVSGVVKLSYNSEGRKWSREGLNIKSGVFKMLKDKYQDLIWIATDGQGVYAYWEDAYHIRSYSYSDFSFQLRKPVRALFEDKEWLWIGTKGEGLVGIDRSDKMQPIHLSPRRLLTSQNSLLKDNSVYALSASSYYGFWVGSEGGLNFYSYATRSLHQVEGEEDLEYVHSIQEVGDSILWLATVGKGVFKANISRNGNSVKLHNVCHFDVQGGHFSFNYFFAMHYTDKGDLWLGNRGYGVFKMYPDGLKPIEWSKKQSSPLQDDVFALYEHNNVLWIGTSCGLIGLGADGEEWYFNQDDGMPNNIVRSLQADSKGGLWIATNGGLARLDSNFNDLKAYGRNDGLRITEFSDGASLRTGDVLYFGAMNGWVEVSENVDYTPVDEYKPQLYLLNFKGAEDKRINLHLLTLNNEKGSLPKIELERDENAFTVSFMAIDYINGGDYQYWYKVDSEKEGTWIDNGKHTVLSLNQLPPGNYTLSIKYYNRNSGYESEPVSLKIQINPYWWQTWIMKFLYWLCAFLAIGYISYLQYCKMKRRHTNALISLEQRHKEELYEEKLRFFTNITHEFSTPLTLIYSPCERILSYKGTDDFVRKYIMLIKKNTERLHQLIQEIIDYRRIETKHQQLYLENYNVSDYVNETCGMFMDLAEKKEVKLCRDIEADLYWNMDRRCFPKIVTNLLSNAMKYTPKGGMVRVVLHKLSDDKLQLRVYNTGKGIKEEDRTRIFNRYSVLDEVEEDSSRFLLRNGLGMAICHSSVQLLKGKIDIESEMGKYAEFIITLPLLPLSDVSEGAVKEVIPLGIQNQEASKQLLMETISGPDESVLPGDVSLSTENRPLVLVVDDNKDILFLLRDVLMNKYVVQTAMSADEALEHLMKTVPALIITDVMMPGDDGISLAKRIKQNKHTMHVPLIILSARNTDEAKSEGLQAGADAYIGKPFNVQYLQAVVNRLIESRKDMKEYYNTSASAFSFVEGRLMKTEDREFLSMFNEVVERNLSNSSLTTELIANELNVTSRTLYRRLKDLGMSSPKDYVRERKMEKVVKLLKTSDMSIQEIVFECGFSNRAHFYKDFGKRFGMTPKEFRDKEKITDESLKKE